MQDRIPAACNIRARRNIKTNLKAKLQHRFADPNVQRRLIIFAQLFYLRRQSVRVYFNFRHRSVGGPQNNGPLRGNPFAAIVANVGVRAGCFASATPAPTDPGAR